MTENIATLLPQRPNQQVSSQVERVQNNSEQNEAALTISGNTVLEDPNQSFSFSLQGAIASLEQSAAQSLNTHGATPQNNALTQAQQDQGSRQAQARENNSPAQPQDPSNGLQSSQSANQRPTALQAATLSPSTSQANQNAQSQNTTSIAAQQSVNPALALSLITAANSASNSSTTPRPALSQTAPASSALGGLSNRGANPSPSSSLRSSQLTPPAPSPASQETQSFNRFLTSRLQGGQTQFDVRLDPPELGRVDIRLVADEKNINNLTLSFENQSTLDFFRRDQESLRTTLQEAGFDTENQTINFELSENNDQNIDSENPNEQGFNTERFSEEGFDGSAKDTEQNQVSPANALPASSTISIDIEGVQNNFRNFSTLSPVSHKLIDVHL